MFQSLLFCLGMVRAIAAPARRTDNTVAVTFFGSEPTQLSGLVSEEIR
jgi:hypothetical protein